MSERTSSWWLAVVASLVGATLLTQTAEPPPPKPEEKPSPTPPPAPIPADLSAGAFVIATVPDPIDTGAGWMFDGFLDAIQRAFEEQGYVLERYHLPWTEKVPNHHREPGVLSFVSGAARQVVLLVGETPTGGVHPSAFERAREIVDDAPLLEGPVQLRILGPSFSGSAASMKKLLDGRTHPWPLRIVSGSATGASVERVFGPDYTRMNLRDDVVLRWLFDYLPARATSLANPPLALLIESNTGYGEQIKEIVQTIRSSTVTGARPNLILVPYSMQIGALRRAYGEKKQPVPTPRQLEEATAEQRLAAKDSRRPIDVPPILVPDMTVPGIEASLRTELTALAKDGVQIVGILGTNTVDKIFLAQQVRKYVPDVRLFTLESDALLGGLEHEELEGMLIASRTPLTRAFPRCSRKTAIEDEHPRVPFSTSAAAGVYDATRRLLDDQAAKQKNTLWLTEVSRGTFFVRERIDLSRGVPKPFAERASSCGKDNDPAPRVPNFFRMLLALFLLFVALNVYLYQRAVTAPVAEIAENRTRPVTEVLSWLLQAFPSAPDQSELRFIAARFSVTLFCLSLLMVPLLVVPTELLDWWDRGLLGACWTGLAISSAVCFDVFLRIERSSKHRTAYYASKIAAAGAPLITLLGTAWASAYRINTFPVLAVAAGLFGLAVVRWIGWVALGAIILGLFTGSFHDFASPATFYDLQVAERFGRLTTAPSPLLVIIAISYALHVWSDCGLRRAIRLRDRPLAARIALLDAILAKRKPKLPNALEISLAAWFGGVSPAKLTLFVLFAVLAPLVYIGLRFLPTLEGRWVDATLFFGLFAVYLASSHALIRLAWTWINLRYVLRELAWHPMVHAFSRLSDRFRASLTSQVYTVGPAEGEYRLASAEIARVASDLGLDVHDHREASWGCATAVAAHLEGFWSSEVRAMAPDQGEPAAHSPVRSVEADPAMLAAEDSIALHVSLFVREMYVHLFAHLAAVVASIVSLVLAVTIYPFQAQRLMLTAAFVVAALSMAVISWALLGMERDNILSRLAGSTPGKIDWTPSFIGKLGAHVLAPVLVLLASQFPSVRILVSELLGVVSLVVR